MNVFHAYTSCERPTEARGRPTARALRRGQKQLACSIRPLQFASEVSLRRTILHFANFPPSRAIFFSFPET